VVSEEQEVEGRIVIQTWRTFVHDILSMAWARSVRQHQPERLLVAVRLLQ
jgi:hypothetical protein